MTSLALSRPCPSAEQLRNKALAVAQPHGWGPAELRDWPLKAFAMIRLFFMVKEQGRWPYRLQWAIVAMLPKGGSSAPDDRCPIIILPIVYRIRAGVRAQEVQSWLGRVETLALDFAFSIQRATWLGQEFDGLPLDWSKRYDHVPLCMLETAMWRAGLGPHIARRFISMYRAPRRIVVDGLVGETRQPRRCVSAGCPAATTLLALTWCCDR